MVLLIFMGKQGRLYVGNLSSASRMKDLEEAFSKYGEINNIDRKIDYAFVVGRDDGIGVHQLA